MAKEERTTPNAGAPSADPLSLPENQVEPRELRVLLLEDVEIDAELVALELRRARLPVEIRCVDTRDGFLVALDEFSPDIILSDYSMPGFTAMEAIHLLNESPYDVPFILVTGSQSEEVAVECMKEGVNDYILKSTLRRLPSAMMNALKQKKSEIERERAIRALKHSEEHFRSLIENALDIIAVLNADGSFRYASPSIRILGYRAEEIEGRNVFEFVSPDDSRELTDLFETALRNPGLSGTVEFLFQHRDGSWRVLEAICKGMWLDAGSLGIVLNARDISERKQAEEAIAKLAAFPRLNPNPIFELTGEGALSYFNRAAEDIARSLGKSHPSEILPSETQSIVNECLHTGRTESGFETRIANRILSWSFFPIIPSNVVHCYAVDITERLNLEAQLRQSQKMESIGQLAAGVAHDFNNILTLIQGYTGLVLGRAGLDPEVADPLQQVAVAAERAANLTRQLLMFSRKQMIQPIDVDLNELIGNVAKFLRRILGEDIVLQFHHAPDLAGVRADPGMIEQVIMNLAVNARDAMPRGGKLSIGTSAVEINSVHVHANPEARIGHFVCLRVTDTGSGIPAEVLTHIFEPFFTTKEVGKGTGLGLATVYGIVKQHQGWIEVLSQVGAGTTFRVFLPMSTVPVAANPAKPAGANIPKGRERILVVEDEPELRTLVREVLQQYGYSVFLASSGPEALSVWRNHADEIDLLLTDMVMPGNMTGRELAERLKTEKPDLKVLFTSGYSVEMVGKDCVLKRNGNFLQKPYHPASLAKMVRGCLDQVTAS
jgi:two-component system cell cycle sensor histidine kinase/response regulator CckA